MPPNRPPNVRILGSVEEPELRWLYANARLLVSAAHEDFGLTPPEAATFAKPVAVLRYGGHLDTFATRLRDLAAEVVGRELLGPEPVADTAGAR